MKDSGYSEKFRLEIVQGGVSGFEKQVESDVSGECPLYRPREFQREKRDKAKKMKRVGWQKPAESVLFLPPTPCSELAKGLEEALNGSSWRVKVIEGWKSMKQLLTTADPLASEGCSRNCCPVHNTGGKGDCTGMCVWLLPALLMARWWEGGERLARQGLLEVNSNRRIT